MKVFEVSLTLKVGEVDTPEEAAEEFHQWARLALTTGHPTVTVSPVGQGDPVDVTL